MQGPRSSSLRSQVAIAGAAEQGGLRTGRWGAGEPVHGPRACCTPDPREALETQQGPFSETAVFVLAKRVTPVHWWKPGAWKASRNKYLNKVI